MTIIGNVYFQKAMAVYRSGYLGSLRVALKMPLKHTSQMWITDFDWQLNILQIYTQHRQQFAPWLSVPFRPPELTYLDAFHSVLLMKPKNS